MLGFPDGSAGKESARNAGDTGDAGSVPGSGRSPGEGNGNPLQYSCLENPMHWGAWRATLYKELHRIDRLNAVYICGQGTILFALTVALKIAVAGCSQRSRRWCGCPFSGEVPQLDHSPWLKVTCPLHDSFRCLLWVRWKGLLIVSLKKLIQAGSLTQVKLRILSNF